MADVNIKGRISVDTGDAGKSIADLNNEIKQTKKVLLEAKIGSEEHKNALASLAQQNTQLKAATDSNNTSQGKSAQAFSTLKEKVGALIPGLKGAEGAGNSFGSTLKMIAMTPVVAILVVIVGALKLIYEAFKNTFEGGQKVEQVFAGIKAAGQSLFDSLDKIGSAIIKVFKLDFSGAVKEIKSVGTAAVDAYNKVAELTKQRQDLDRKIAVNDYEQAVREKDLAKLRAEAYDDTIPIAQRIGKLKTLQKAAQEDAKKDLDLNRDDANNKIKTLQQGKDGAEKHFKEILKIKADYVRQETQSNNELKAIGKTLTQAERQVETERKQLATEAEALRKDNQAKRKENQDKQDILDAAALKAKEKYQEALKKGDADEIKMLEDKGKELKKQQDTIDANEKTRIETNKKNELTAGKKVAELDTLNDPKSITFKIAKIKADLALELNALEEGDLQRQILMKKAADAEVKINAEAAEAKKQIADLEAENKMKNVTAVGSILSSLGSLVGKQTAVGKGIAVAASLIDTYVAIVGTLRAAAKTPMGGIPGYAIAQSVATGIAGFAAVKNILKVQVPGGGGGSSPSIGSLAAPLAPAPIQTSTSLNQSSINGIGNAANGGVGRSFILDSDVRNNAERSARINRAARIS